MGNNPKLSVEKALEKLLGSEPPKTQKERHDDRMGVLDEDTDA
jgi:hypothetical protein